MEREMFLKILQDYGFIGILVIALAYILRGSQITIRYPGFERRQRKKAAYS